MHRFIKIKTNSFPNVFMIRRKSYLFENISKILNINNFDDFQIQDRQVLLDCFEKSVVDLSDMLKRRVEPEQPNIFYLHTGHQYVEKTIFDKKYRLLQGDENDNKVLLLLELKNLLGHALLNEETVHVISCNTLGT